MKLKAKVNGVKIEAVRRPFYPANLSPDSAEIKDHKTRFKAFDDLDKEIVQQTDRYRVAKDYLANRKRPQLNMMIAAAVGIVLLLGCLADPDPIHKMITYGVSDEAGKVLFPGRWKWFVYFFLQGTLGLWWMLSLFHQKRKNQSYLDVDRHNEFVKKAVVTQERLWDTLIPAYKENNPFDPTDDDFKIVLGESYLDSPHKFGPTVHWYTISIRGIGAGGLMIYGITGSGKTSSCLKPIMRQVFSYMANVDYDPKGKGREKMAGLVLDPKGSLAFDVNQVLKSAGIDPLKERPILEGQVGKEQVFLTPLLFMKNKENLEAQKAQMIQPVNENIEKVQEQIKKVRGGRKRNQLAPKDKEALRVLGIRLKGLHREKTEVEAAFKKMSRKKYIDMFREEVEVGEFNPAQMEKYEGRGADYLELGYDRQKVQRIWSGFQDIQEASKALEAGSGKVLLFPEDKKDKSLTGSIQIARPSHRTDFMGDWKPEGKPENLRAIKGSCRLLMESLEQMVALSFIGTTQRRNLFRGSGQSNKVRMNLEFNNQFPGTRLNIEDLEAYSNIRKEIRIIAPTKERPGEDLLKYRTRWLRREKNLRAFNASMKNLTEQVWEEARTLEVISAGESHTVAYAQEIVSSMEVFTTPMSDLLGPDAVRKDTGIRRSLVVDSSLRELMKRVTPQLSPQLRERIAKDDYSLMTVVQGDIPRPHAVDVETKRSRGPRHADPDPTVLIVLQATEMRSKEKALARRINGRLKQSLGIVKLESLRRRHVERLHSILLQKGASDLNAGEFSMRVVGGLFEDVAKVVERYLALETASEIARMPGKEAVKWYEDGIWASYVAHVQKAFAIGYAKADLDCMAIDSQGSVQAGFGRLFSDKIGSPQKRLLDRYSGATVFQETLGSMIGAESLSVHSDLLRNYHNLITQALSECVGEIMRMILPELCQDLDSPEVTAEIQELWRSGQAVMKDIVKGYDERIFDAWEEQDSISSKGRQPVTSFEGLDELLMFKAKAGDVMSPGIGLGFWQGLTTGDDLIPMSVIQWDQHWSEVFWKRLAYLNLSAPKSASWRAVGEWGMSLEGYQQACLKSFVAYIAPNAGHRCEGPFCFNPLYLPELDPLNIAFAFSKTVFAAQAKEGSSSDPYWENAAFSLIYNLLKILYLTENYATFPKIRQLISNEKLLEAKIAELEHRRQVRAATSQEMDDIQKVLEWYRGEWKNPGAEKGETKANVVSTLSVVTQPFTASDYQVVFAPQSEDDISFPGWVWCFRHGKVVAANLPTEEHEKVAQVVLPLLNKSFTKAVMMRESQREQTKELMANGQRNIFELERQRQESLDELQAKVVEFSILDEIFGRGMVGGAAAPMSLIRRLLDPAAMASRAQGSEAVLDSLTRLLACSGVTSDQLVAITLGWEGKASVAPFTPAWSRVSPAIRGALNAGWFLREVFAWEGAPEWAKLPLRDKGRAPESVPESVGRSIDQFLGSVRQYQSRLSGDRIRGDVVHELHLMGESEESLARLEERIQSLPLGLGLPRLTILGQENRNRLKLKHDALAAETRETGEDVHLSIHGQLDRLTREIRSIHDRVEDVPNSTRLVVWMVDEAQFYLTGDEDAKYLSVSRSANALNFISTQSPNAIYNKMGENAAKQFMDNLPNRLILRAVDAKAAQDCAEMLGGKVRMDVMDRSITQSFDHMKADALSGGGRGKASGGSISTNFKQEERYIVEPSEIVNLMGMEAFAFTWDGKKASAPKRIFMKPDFLYTDPEARNFVKAKSEDTKFKKVPVSYPDGTDFYPMPVLRLMQLGILDTSVR